MSTSRSRRMRPLLVAVIMVQSLAIGWLMFTFRVELYQKVASRAKCRLLFLGDSMTSHAGVWGWWLGRWRPDNQNFGRAGADLFVIRSVAREVIPELHPECVVIMGGVNDPARQDAAGMIQDYSKLIEAVRANPEVKHLIIVSTLYQCDGLLTPALKALNVFLENECKRQDMTFLDLRPVLCIDDKLRREVSTDGLHLNAEGYRLWVREMKPVLLKLGL